MNLDQNIDNHDIFDTDKLYQPTEIVQDKKRKKRQSNDDIKILLREIDNKINIIDNKLNDIKNKFI